MYLLKPLSLTLILTIFFVMNLSNHSYATNNMNWKENEKGAFRPTPKRDPAPAPFDQEEVDRVKKILDRLDYHNQRFYTPPRQRNRPKKREK